MAFRIMFALCVSLVCLRHDVAQAQSMGHYHLPSTMPQFCGLGYGAGHHVPMVREHHCHPPRIPRYVHVPGCVGCPMPMACFESCSSANCHEQLDRLIGTGEHGDITPTPEKRSILIDEGVLPLPGDSEPPQLDMLPKQ